MTSVRHAAGSVVAWGVLLGLLVGKPAGVLLAARGALHSGRVDAPEGTAGRHLVGAGAAAGIGFTVALFVAELAFTDEQHVTDAKMAILVASVLSGVVAFVVLRGARPTGGDPTSQSSASSPVGSASPSR